MPTLGIWMKYTYANKHGRTTLDDFYKSLEVEGYQNRELRIPAGATGVLNLGQSKFLLMIVDKESEAVNLKLKNTNGHALELSQVDHLCINADNLGAVEITNPGTREALLNFFY